MTCPATPHATYRLQLNRAFGFAAAREIVPYLHALGISHCYASPYLKARPGSLHGYDIVDHTELNPELGDRQTYADWVRTLAAHDMGHILDMVPNHMGVGGADNVWWLDVLEHGEASVHAAYFDIDWQSFQPTLRGRLLLPVLGGHYGDVLESGELQPRYAAEEGSFSIWYHEHRFPLDPVSYPAILEPVVAALGGAGGGDARLPALQQLIGALRGLPARDVRDPQQRRQRIGGTARLKRELAALTQIWPALAAHIEAALEALRGTPGEAASFDRLHALLEAQAYRLAYWRVAADEINYRRFFDINDLAGLRMEEPAVFADTHRLALELITTGSLQGLRIDHPDGLRDPLGYLRRLRAAIAAAGGPDDFYLIVEKILMPYEHLPEVWPVDGTTGYDFAASVNGLFVDPAGERPLTRLHARYTGARRDFDALLHERKKLIIRSVLSSELTVLAGKLSRIAQRDRHTRDYTLNGLRDALSELVACFPVYRSYVDAEGPGEQDRRYLEWALIHAERRSRTVDASLFGFLRALLGMGSGLHGDAGLEADALDFVARLQQYTAPVMAKSLEDTCFYIDNRLVSLNEVGGDPNHFGVSVAAFHRASQERQRRWPRAMLTTSTHDSKRSEDVRARLDALSELPQSWRQRVARWSRINAARKRLVDGVRVPSRNDEYLLYQTLLGVWPLEPVAEDGLERLRERVTAYMIKAVREAKVHSAWLNPDAEYESGVEHFVRSLLRASSANAFLADFLPFQRRIASIGICNSLAQTLLKLTAPGVPDIYQGCELFEFRLVDPDNRRPVDYAARRTLLESLEPLLAPERDVSAETRALLDTPGDGRAKLYLTARILRCRRAHARLFAEGDYRVPELEGAGAARVCAFARHGQDGSCAVIVAPCRFGALTAGGERPPLGSAVWEDTAIVMPDTAPALPPAPHDAAEWRELLTGRRFRAGRGSDGQPRLELGRILDSFPVALLLRDADDA
ncbi:MAG: malto-oligosyltrehalose synthase [Gammaproteobacteria bacterium]|nr:malto-oligosyltrehalose synthase [Gammaproteobacteria bacterium]